MEKIKYIENWSSEFGKNLFLLRWYYWFFRWILFCFPSKSFEFIICLEEKKSEKYKELSEKKTHKTIFELFFSQVFFW